MLSPARRIFLAALTYIFVDKTLLHLFFFFFQSITSVINAATFPREGGEKKKRRSLLITMISSIDAAQAFPLINSISRVLIMPRRLLASVVNSSLTRLLPAACESRFFVCLFSTVNYCARTRCSAFRIDFQLWKFNPPSLKTREHAVSNNGVGALLFIHSKWRLVLILMHHSK